MTPQEQQELFERLRKSYPHWPAAFLNGYVNGALHESLYKRPMSAFVEQAADLNHYALGYLTGFAVHRGPDCETEAWYNFAGLMVPSEER